jgi:very-short-patch-repair endonuclease
MADVAARRELLRFASLHHGVFTFHQWLAHGLSASELDREVRRGLIERLHPGVYRVVGAPPTWRGQLMAAVAGAGEHALASHRSAIALWQLAGTTGRTIELTVPRHRRVARAGALVHECVDLPGMDRAEIDGIPVTAVHRALLDACRFVVAERVGDYLDDAVRRGLTTYSRTAAWLGVVARSGVHGVTRLRGVLAERPGGMVPPGSTFERRMLELIRDHGLPEPERQVTVRADGHDFALDFAWPTAKVGVEADGAEFHTLTSQIEHDKWRQNLIQLEGWFLLRYSPTALRRRPDDCAEQIRLALSGAGDPRPSE